MIIPDIVWAILYVIMFTQALIWIIWRISCFFKKTCHWKSCPYRQHYFQSHSHCLPGPPCKKFPPTQAEIDKHNKMLEETLKNL